MKKLMLLAVAGVLMLGSGCTTGSGTPSIDVAAITNAIVAGYATYEQIQALKDEVDACEGSMAAPSITDVITGGGGTTTDSATTATSTPDTPDTITPIPGRAVVVVLGNVATCSYCAKLYALHPEALVEGALPLVDWINADYSMAPEVYATYKPKVGFLYPLIRVFDLDGVLKGEFVARNMTVAQIIAKITEVCPSCGG